jgi:uncharacterized protein
MLAYIIDDNVHKSIIEGDMSKQTALITGASGGIGLELATLLAQDGYDLILVARSGGKLQELADQLKAKHNSTSTVIAMDLSEPNAPAQLYADVQARGLAVDVLVNNAGFGLHGLFDQVDLVQQLNMIQLNVTALTHLTHLFLPAIKARKRGGIMNVASIVSFLPGPYMAVYHASKAFVLSLSEALAEELAGTGITVTAVCPGATASDFHKRADNGVTDNTNGMMSSAEVALIGYQAFKRGQRVIVTGMRNKINTWAPRFLPRDMVAGIVKRVQTSRKS